MMEDPRAGRREPSCCQKLVATAVQLGAELRRYRVIAGVSQTELTQMLGFSARSNLSDYERGARVPPRDIVIACESLLRVPPGVLTRLLDLAQREQADAAAASLLGRLGGPQ